MYILMCQRHFVRCGQQVTLLHRISSSEWSKCCKLLCQSFRSIVLPQYENTDFRSRKTVRHIQGEMKAYRKLLARSDVLNRLSPAFLVSGNGCLSQSQPFSTSVYCMGQEKGGQDKKDSTESDGNQDGSDSPKDKIIIRFLVAGLVATLLYASSITPSSRGYVPTTWHEFATQMLAKGEVQEIFIEQSSIAVIKLYPGAVIKGQSVSGHPGYYLTLADSTDEFEEKLRHIEKSFGIPPGKGVPVSYTTPSMVTTALSVLLNVLVLAIVAFYLRKGLRSLPQMMGQNMFSNFTKANFLRADTTASSTHQGITFKDVAGLHEAKVEVMEFVDYLKSSDRYKNLGAKIPKGALLTGPPGCGKTLLAKAVANEAKVPFLVMAGSEFVDVIGGVGAARVRDLFKEARSKSPCIIYVDEIDSIGKMRDGGSGAGNQSMDEDQTLNQLLVEMDGMGTIEGVIMLASTNRASVLDKALLRPGRLDRHILIDLPTLQERKEMFEMYLSKMRIARPATAYSERLSQLSPGMSGADIANICNEAALYAARNVKARIDTEDFDYAVERVIAGVAKKTRLMTLEEKRMVAYHEAGHALVGWLLKHTDTLLKVSIVPRTTAVAGYAQYMPQDKKLHSKDELIEKMCLMLGGRAAESVIFNSVTSGAQDDFKKVTKTAYSMVTELGMSERVGNLAFGGQQGVAFEQKPYSKMMARLIDQEAQKLVSDAYQATEKLIQDNKEKLRVVAEMLLEREELNYNDMEELLGPPPHNHKLIKSAWSFSNS